MRDIDLKERIKEEFTKCSTDYVYATKHYLKIEHPMKGKIPFHLFPFQERSLAELQNHRFNIILKSRQMGISTLLAADSLLKMLFNENFKILVIATTQDVARNLVRKVKVMHDNAPSWLRGELEDNNKLSISFKNGSSIKAVSSSAHSGRSEALSMLIIDEAAFVDRIDSIWGAALPTLSTGGSATLLSTPNGMGNLFHKLWSDAESGEAVEGLEPFNAIKLKWDLHPERDQKWRDQQTSLLGERLAAQECDCDFLTSGHTVVPVESLKWYNDTYVMDPIQTRGEGNDVWIWKFVNYNKNYLITADIARGDGSDYSTFHIFDVETLEQVAEYKGKIGTREFGRMLAAYGHEYNTALIVPDNKNIGWDTVQELIDIKYPNLYYSFKADPFMDPSIHLAKGYDLKNRRDMVPGFTTTPSTRPVIISKLQTYFEQKVPIIHSSRLINELYMFKWIDGKPQAQRGYHDDLVIPCAIAFFIRDTTLRLRQLGIDITKKSLGGTHKVIHKPMPSIKNPLSYRTPNGHIENLNWLL